MALCLRCNHSLADGTSFGKVPGIINTFYMNPSSPSPLKEPQLVPLYPNFLMPKRYDLDDSIVPTCGPGVENNGYLNSSVENPPRVEDRKVLFTTRHVPHGVIKRYLPNCRLTACFLGLHSFMILSLLFHQHPMKDKIGCSFGQLRLPNLSLYDNPFPDSLEQLFGVRITTVPTTYTVERNKFSVHYTTNVVDSDVTASNNPQAEFAICKWFLAMPRKRECDLKGTTDGRHRVSNVGMLSLPEGPIKGMIGIGNGGDEFGTLHLCPLGLPDGTVVLVLDCDKACFTKEFANYYLEVYELLWRRLLSGDIDHEEFASSAEFMKLCELLDVKKPK
eukprot:gnl/Chilomastix_caulleri/232.p1 GENE.gnl/Chilomastix_caulleri/232~~gnl/Chilomastix_caulleri/232.p1  ORF type:complete len:333 (+),score=73.06 gnl/Chilomastix_caulleri/232:214-1212(+)